MRHAPIEEITGVSPVVPVEGVFYGNHFTKQDFQQFGDAQSSTYFSGNVHSHHQTFFQQIVQPGIDARARMQETLTIQNPTSQSNNECVWFETVDDMRNIPESMRVPMLLHPYVRRLAEAGRIDDWGIDVSQYPEDNPFQRMIHNGVVEDVTYQPAENGDYVVTVTDEWQSTDPQMSEKDIACIEQMYKLLDEEDRSGSEISPTDRDVFIA